MLFPKNEICLCDFSWLAYRALYSKESDRVSSFVGNVYAGPTFVLYQSLLAISKRWPQVVYVLDGWPKAKHELFKEYKAQRKETREADPNYQLNKNIRNQLRNWIVQSIPSVIAYLPDQEADDCIGSLSHQLSAQGVTVHILCSDKDLWQLKNSKIHLWKVDGDFVEITDQDVNEHFGVEPLKIPLVKAWFGDASDNIPKLFRMPSKYAMPMIKACKDVDECVARVGEFVKDAKWVPKFVEFADTAKRNLDLATINRNLKVPFAYFKPDPQPLQALLESYYIKQFTADMLFEVFGKNQIETLQLLLRSGILDPQNTIPFEDLVKKVG